MDNNNIQLDIQSSTSTSTTSPKLARLILDQKGRAEMVPVPRKMFNHCPGDFWTPGTIGSRVTFTSAKDATGGYVVWARAIDSPLRPWQEVLRARQGVKFSYVRNCIAAFAEDIATAIFSNVPFQTKIITAGAGSNSLRRTGDVDLLQLQKELDTANAALEALLMRQSMAKGGKR